MTEVRVAGGDLAGYTILLDMQVDKDYWLGTYEPELQRALRELVPPGRSFSTWVRISATCRSCWRKPGGGTGRVFAFEALPSNVEQLRRNLALNGMESQVTVVPGAVTQTSGPVTLPGACLRRDG